MCGVWGGMRCAVGEGGGGGVETGWMGELWSGRRGCPLEYKWGRVTAPYNKEAVSRDFWHFYESNRPRLLNSSLKQFANNFVERRFSRFKFEKLISCTNEMYATYVGQGWNSSAIMFSIFLKARQGESCNAKFYVGKTPRCFIQCRVQLCAVLVLAESDSARCVSPCGDWLRALC